MLGLHLDRRRGGTHYADRLHRILGVCHACGILWDEVTISNRDGSGYKQRMELVRPAVSLDPDTPPDRKGQPLVLVTTQYEKYALSVNPKVLTRIRNMAPQFAYALNVPSVAVEVDGNVVFIRVPRECSVEDSIVLFEQAWALAPDIQPGDLLLGVDEEQNQLLLPLAKPDHVHCMVIGMTGSGKSTLMKTMILSAEMSGGSKVALFDPSGGFQALSGHPSVWRGGMFRRADECERGLDVLARMVEGSNDENSVTYVFVDEVPELVRQRPQIKEHLGRIAQGGRHAGLHLILGAQHPLVSELGSATLRNIPVRIIGRVADRTAAYNAAGRADSGAEHLRGGGDFIGFTGSTKKHFQAAMPSPELLDQWVHRYPPRPPRVPPRSVSRVQAAQAPGAPAPTEPEPPSPAKPGGNGRGGGRGLDEIDEWVITAIQERHKAGERVTPGWVRGITSLRGGEYRQDKAERAVEQALAKLT